jgi:hypothetical protein
VSGAPASPGHGGWGDRGRLFLTAWLVYAVFVNPVLANPMAWASLDAAVSLVETGRWRVTHGALYHDMDVALMLPQLERDESPAERRWWARRPAWR